MNRKILKMGTQVFVSKAEITAFGAFYRNFKGDPLPPKEPEYISAIAYQKWMSDQLGQDHFMCVLPNAIRFMNEMGYSSCYMMNERSDQGAADAPLKIPTTFLGENPKISVENFGKFQYAPDNFKGAEGYAMYFLGGMGLAKLRSQAGSGNLPLTFRPFQPGLESFHPNFFKLSDAMVEEINIPPSEFEDLVFHS